MLLYLGFVLWIIKDQTEAKSTFVVDPDNPFWTVNKNSALSDSQRYIMSVNLAYDLAPWMKINYHWVTTTEATIENFQRYKIVEVLQMGFFI
jgi:hypothetical protein